MTRHFKKWMGFGLVLGLTGAARSWANDASVTVIPGTPVAVSTVVPVAVQPVAVSTTSIAVPVTQVPVVIPGDMNRSQDIVAWKRLEGTVQAVDRTNHAFIVQDREGKDVRVVLNERIQISRSGQLVSYSDVEPNDRVVLQFTPAVH